MMQESLHAALFAALRFTDPSFDRLANLRADQWRELANLSDRAQLTLPLLDAADRYQTDVLPAEIRRRFELARKHCAERAQRVQQEFRDIQAHLTEAGLPVVVLKGFAGAPYFYPEPERRMQYDLDLYLYRESGEVSHARYAADVVTKLGYEQVRSQDGLPMDHLPVMIRKTGWEWRGDFFDPEIPFPIDIHFRLWDEQTEGFAAPGWEDFWDRRERREWGGIAYEAFRMEDLLAYHSLHLLRHILRGSLRLSHVYELAHFLDKHQDCADFWESWRQLHSQELRRLQAITFGVAERWFGCRMAAIPNEEIGTLPDQAKLWLAEYVFAPVEGIRHPNKHELWLHLGLLDGTSTKLRVLRRRLFPFNVPGPVDGVHIPDSEKTLRIRAMSQVRRVHHILRRLGHHTRVLPGVAAHGTRWYWRSSEIGALRGPYWRFIGAATCFNLGAFVFFVLYNLHLLELGYQEDVLGYIVSAMTVGSIVGTLPAGLLLRHVGIRGGLMTCFLLAAVASAGRSAVTSEPVLLALAFVFGTAFSIFSVAVAPTIAATAPERIRPRAFSIFFAVGISLGIVGGVLGGWLPGVLGSTQAALFFASGLMGLAAIPAMLAPASAGPSREPRTFPRGPFIRTFLTAIAIWTAAIGAFTPFFNAYFTRQYDATAQQVGLTYSVAQTAQVVAILIAPVVLRRLGLARGVAVSQIASAAALALLLVIPGTSSGLVAGSIAYAGFMGLHYMGEPGLYSLLMKGVTAEERSGASALHSLVMFGSQAVAVAVSGAVAARSGYGPVIGAASLLAVLAGLVLWRWLPGCIRDQSE